MTGLLEDTAEYWKSKGVTVRKWLSDDEGRYAFKIRVQFHEDGDQHTFWVAARKYMQTPLGVMKKVVARAYNDDDALLLIRVGDDSGRPAFYVFDPQGILTHGKDNTAAPERERRGEKWVDFHPHWGVRLQDFAVGDRLPVGPSDPAEPLPSDAEDGAADKSHTRITDY